MRALLQRVHRAEVRVDDQVVGQIEQGWLILLGVAQGDGESDLTWIVEKIANLRAFPDEAGKMNRSIQEVDGSVLVVSQFTLMGDCRTGRRPSFTDSAPPSQAEPLYQECARRLASLGLTVATGQFGAQMDVELVNNGPVTLLLDSTKIL